MTRGRPVCYPVLAPWWRNGMRRGLKIPGPNGHVGSIPTHGTTLRSFGLRVARPWRDYCSGSMPASQAGDAGLVLNIPLQQMLINSSLVSFVKTLPYLCPSPPTHLLRDGKYVGAFPSKSHEGRVAHGHTASQRGRTKIDLTLRPAIFVQFIARFAAQENLSIFIEAARTRNEPLEHVLFMGTPAWANNSGAHRCQ